MKLVFFEVQDWEKGNLQMSFPQAQIFSETLSQANVDQFQDVEIVSCFTYSTFNKELLDKLPKLKLIASRTTGYDHIDVDYAKLKEITVCNVPEYGSRTVAEHTFALMLTLTRKIYQSINQAKHFDFDHRNIQGIDIFDKTLGIIGLGKIGTEVVKIAKGFGMNVIAFNRTQDQDLAQKLGFMYVDLPTLLSNSDIITLHLPYCKETHHIINKTNITQIKKGSYLINTARGGLIDTEAIVWGLQNSVLEGVGLDVLEEEKELSEETEVITSRYRENVDLKTLILDHMLIDHPRVVITPHNAFNTKEALERILLITVKNIQSFLEGKPLNTVR